MGIFVQPRITCAGRKNKNKKICMFTYHQDKQINSWKTGSQSPACNWQDIIFCEYREERVTTRTSFVTKLNGCFPINKLNGCFLEIS